MDLRIEIADVAGHHTLVFDGTVDLAAVPKAQQALVAFTQRAPGGALAVDLTSATVVDDAVLGLLLGAAARARAAGSSFVVVCPDDRLRDRLGAARFDRAVDVVAALSATPESPGPGGLS